MTASADDLEPQGARPAGGVFEPVHDRYGLRLSLVFGNHAPGGRCPYHAAARCWHCDLGAGEGAAFDLATNLRRLAWFRRYYADTLPRVAHLVLFNSGSTLNPRELPPPLLGELLAFARSLPAAQVISLDSREPYVTSGAVVQVARALRAGQVVRPILGLESADERIRNGLLAKQMPRAAVLRAFAATGAAARELGPGRVGLDVNVVVGGPGTTPVTVVEDAVETARFALRHGQQEGVPVDLNLHPYYPSARGQTRFPDQRRCPLSILPRVVEEIAKVSRALGAGAGIFIGLEDEGHDREQALRDEELGRVREAIARFNRSQEPGALATW